MVTTHCQKTRAGAFVVVVEFSPLLCVVQFTRILASFCCEFSCSHFTLLAVHNEEMLSRTCIMQAELCVMEGEMEGGIQELPFFGSNLVFLITHIVFS